jgi:hypothetical protein
MGFEEDCVVCVIGECIGSSTVEMYLYWLAEIANEERDICGQQRGLPITVEMS